MITSALDAVAVLKPLIGLANEVQAQLRLRPLAADLLKFPSLSPPVAAAVIQCVDDVNIPNPAKIPPHFTRSFIRRRSSSPPPQAAPSLCDSTRRSAQSPNPVEIRSRKSPEKLRLPHPTDLDLDTFRPNDEDRAPPGLSGAAAAAAGGGSGSGDKFSDPICCCFGSNLLRKDQDQKLLLRGVSAAVSARPPSWLRVVADLLRRRALVLDEEEEEVVVLEEATAMRLLVLWWGL